MNAIDLAGRRAVVTGGAQGIGYAIAERYGAGSPLGALAPRALYVCETDSACAAALFAVYAEGVRPDLDVVPAQHLWDPTVVRRLRGLSLAEADDAELWPSPGQRASWASRRQRELLRPQQPRPIYLERAERLPQHVAGYSLASAPYIRLSATGASDEAELASLLHARFGAHGPATVSARELWASAHETLGALWLASGREHEAVTAFARAVALTPNRAVARSNLGVALERTNDLAGALDQTMQAVELDPLRPTPWVNLARLLLRTEGAEAARAALQSARRYQLKDPRLDAMTRELQLAPDAIEGTTRK